MGAQSRDIAEAIRALSGMDDLQYESVICTVSNINKTKMLCDCSPVNGDADFTEVRLNANYKKGFVLVPKNGSVVVVSQVSNEVAYISMVSEVDEILLAGDDNGGIVKVSELTTKLNNLENQLNNLIADLLTIAVTLTSGGTTPLLSSVLGGLITTNLSNVTTPLTPTQSSELENTTVKHGNG